MFAGDKDDLLSSDKDSDFEGEMTATITELSIPNRTCQRLYGNSMKEGGKKLEEGKSQRYIGRKLT